MADAGAPAAGAGAGGGAAAPPAHWAGESADDRGFAELKGWKGPGDAFKSYRELESFRGVPAERLLQLPQKDDDAEGWGKVYGRLGRPEKVEGYGIEGADPELLAEAHAAGLTKAQATRLATYLGKRGTAAQEKAESERAAQSQLEEQELRREWGPEFDANMRHAREVASRLYKAMGYKGVQELQDHLSAVEREIGTGRFYRMMAFLGRGTAEHRFVDGGSGSGFGDMTPQAARAKFDALSSDVEFMRRIQSGDPAAKAEWDRYAKLAESTHQGSGPQR